jgi:hypothetical protein
MERQESNARAGGPLVPTLQENLVAQLKGGVKALAMPVDDLVSNWRCETSRT